MRWPLDRKPIGWLEPCRCESGSGLVLKDCCIGFVKAKRSAVEHGVGAYLMLSELWPKVPPEIQDPLATIARFDPHDLVQIVARLNIFLQDDFATPRSEKELVILKLFLPPVWYKKAFMWIVNEFRQKAVHRLVFPAMLQQVLARAADATSELKVENNRGLVGQIALALNQMVEDEYQDRRKKAKNRAERMQVLYASMYRDGFYSHLTDYPTSLGRAWTIITRGIPAAVAKKRCKPFDFEAEFHRLFGFTVRDMFAYGYCVFVHYSTENKKLFTEGPGTFVIHRKALQTVVPPERLEESARIFDYLALPWDEHVREARKWSTDELPRNVYRLFPLYDHPLIQMPDGNLFALDAHFLRARITEGSYWALFFALRDDKKGRERELRDAFGPATEWYVAELLRQTFDEKDRWLGWDNQIRADGCRNPDAVVQEGDTLFFIEVTTSSIHAAEAASADPEVIGPALRRLWFGEGPDDSPKLKQLSGAITAFRDGRIALPGLDPTETPNIRPVLVTLRQIPQWPILCNWYREIMEVEGLPPDFRKDLVFWDVEEVEELSAVKLRGESWRSILAEKKRFTHPDVSMHNFLGHTGRLRERDPVTQAAVLEAVAEFEAKVPA